MEEHYLLMSCTDRSEFGNDVDAMEHKIMMQEFFLMMDDGMHGILN